MKKYLLVGWSRVNGRMYYETLIEGGPKHMWKWTVGFGIIDTHYEPFFIIGNRYEVTKFLK